MNFSQRLRLQELVVHMSFLISRLRIFWKEEVCCSEAGIERAETGYGKLITILENLNKVSCFLPGMAIIYLSVKFAFLLGILQQSFLGIVMGRSFRNYL